MKHPSHKGHMAPTQEDDPMDVLFENFNPARTMGLDSAKPTQNATSEAVDEKNLFTIFKWVAGISTITLILGFWAGMTWQKNADGVEMNEKQRHANQMIADNTARYAWTDMLNGNIQHIAKDAHLCHAAKGPNTPSPTACAYIFDGIKADAMAWPVFDENKLAMAHVDTPEEQEMARKGAESKFLTHEGGQ